MLTNMKKLNDKTMHFLVCMAIAFIVSTVMANVSYVFAPDNPGARTATAYGAALFVAMAIGVSKECRDRRQADNHFCWKDLAADAAGAALGACGAAVSYLI